MCRCIRKTDTEQAALAREAAELLANPQAEQRELSAIYEKAWAHTAAGPASSGQQLMAHDALAAHARDELGLSPELSARPLQAALASASSFAVGAALPLLVVALSPPQFVMASLSITAIAFLARARAVLPRGLGVPNCGLACCG
jgi:VIT1/CCC1 family predicted Fe2+/Mn2+ transporter